MDKKQSHVIERILDLTLEIIYLLTGEYYKVVKETSGEPLTPSRTSPHTWPPPQVNSGKKILEVIKKMTELMTGEVGTKYLDITREEYLEGHKNTYKDIVMEDEPDGSRKRNPPQRCLRPQDSTQEDETISHLDQDEELKDIKIKVKEEEDEMAVSEAQQSMEEGDPLYFWDDSMTYNSSAENNQNVKLKDLRVEDKEKEKTLGQEQNDIGVKTEEGGTLFSGAQQSTEEAQMMIMKTEQEESSLHTDAYERHVWNMPEEDLFLTPAQGIMQHFPGATVITQNHQTSMDPSNFQESSDTSQTGTAVLNHEGNHTRKSSFTCLECRKTFTKKRNLHRHQKIHAAGRPSCLECGKCFIHEEQLLIHQFTIHNGERPYTCLTCGKSFTLKRSLLRHQKIHTGERPFSCPECGKCFVNKGNLVSHQKIHMTERNFPCSECGKSFIRKTDLYKHERIHTGERPYSCSDCDKSFTVKARLHRHQKVHTGNRPFSCPECGNSFFRKEDLLSHQKIHTGERPHLCSECGKCFTVKKVLLIHQRIHTGVHPYKCSDCGKTFMRIEGLHNHRKSHTGERPYSCLECGKSFVEKKKLQRHQITHTDERPYSCLKCGKSFSRNDDLIRHQKSHSGKRRYLC